MLDGETSTMRDEPSQTAETVCLFRAADRMRPPAARILDDPYAERFLGPSARAALTAFKATGWLGRRAERRVPGVAGFVVTRHRQIDEWLLRALDDGFSQVVLLGAGYDARAWRFEKELRGRPVFELDFPSTSERKRRVVAHHGDAFPDPRVEHVPIDFLSESIDRKLLAAGFRPGERSLFVWEGVSMYLTRDAVKATLRAIRGLAGMGSRLAMDWWYLLDDPSARGTAHRTGPAFLHVLGEPVTLSLHPEDVGAFLEREGYELCELVDAARLAERFVRDGRPVYPATYLVLAETR
jgi:methyltransferase (TIGR00027 family)